MAGQEKRLCVRRQEACSCANRRWTKVIKLQAPRASSTLAIKRIAQNARVGNGLLWHATVGIPVQGVHQNLFGAAGRGQFNLITEQARTLVHVQNHQGMFNPCE
jgi:hypothetical protein